MRDTHTRATQPRPPCLCMARHVSVYGTPRVQVKRVKLDGVVTVVDAKNVGCVPCRAVSHIHMQRHTRPRRDARTRI
jgi:hypothetical protein